MLVEIFEIRPQQVGERNYVGIGRTDTGLTVTIRLADEVARKIINQIATQQRPYRDNYSPFDLVGIAFPENILVGQNG